MRYQLTCNIYSHFKPSVIYGEKGEEVRIIKERGNVVIVENKKGSRFSLSKSLITEWTEPAQEVRQDKKEEKIIFNQAPRIKKKKEAPKQNTLF